MFIPGTRSRRICSSQRWPRRTAFSGKTRRNPIAAAREADFCSGFGGVAARPDHEPRALRYGLIANLRGKACKCPALQLLRGLHTIALLEAYLNPPLRLQYEASAQRRRSTWQEAASEPAERSLSVIRKAIAPPVAAEIETPLSNLSTAFVQTHRRAATHSRRFDATSADPGAHSQTSSCANRRTRRFPPLTWSPSDDRSPHFGYGR